jgi:hypothetical protein
MSDHISPLYFQKARRPRTVRSHFWIVPEKAETVLEPGSSDNADGNPATLARETPISSFTRLKGGIQSIHSLLNNIIRRTCYKRRDGYGIAVRSRLIGPFCNFLIRTTRCKHIQSLPYSKPAKPPPSPECAIRESCSNFRDRSGCRWIPQTARLFRANEILVVHQATKSAGGKGSGCGLAPAPMVSTTKKEAAGCPDAMPDSAVSLSLAGARHE